MTYEAFALSVVVAAMTVYLVIAVTVAWLERPRVMWDDRHGRWRSRRSMQWERERGRR